MAYLCADEFAATSSATSTTAPAEISDGSFTEHSCGTEPAVTEIPSVTVTRFTVALTELSLLVLVVASAGTGNVTPALHGVIV
eukprot:15255-Heterococcus_DN1.PRE.1